MTTAPLRIKYPVGFTGMGELLPVPRATGDAIPARLRTKPFGLGNCYTDALSAGLPASPSCIASVFSGPAYSANPADALPGSTVQKAQNPQYATMPFGSGSTTTMTLDSFMAQWAYGAAADPSGLQGQDPIQAANQVAADYCATENPPDCTQMAQIANTYGQQVAAAFKASAGMTWSGAQLIPVENALAPPQSNSPVTRAQIQQGQNQSGSNTPLGPNAGTPSASSSGSAASGSFVDWIEQNWILVALGVGALVLFGGKR